MQEKKLIPKLTVVGVGLIGGSLALALKGAGMVGEVVGVGRGQANLETALERGVIDSFTHDVGEGVSGADLVFLSTPIQTMSRVASAALAHMKPGAVLTDGGSVKQFVVEQIEPLLPPGVHFVPGHPIAGTERTGSAAAFGSLFQGRRCILTPTDRTDPGALDLVRRMWQAAGSEVVTMDATRHDRVLAAVSHLPHMVAYALVNTVSCEDRFGENIIHYSAGGFRDFTRIASSDPTMWRDIALTNREALLEVVGYFESVLAELKDDIAAGAGERLFNFFLRSKERRDAIL
jgi:prephenate dehydrogenase